MLLRLFLTITLAPSILLLWFGWRSLDQDRALALQEVHDRREQAADLIVAGLEQSLAAAEQALRDAPSMQELAVPEGAVAIVLERDRVETFPKGRLLYYPISPRGKEAPAGLFAAAEELEFHRADYRGAAAALRDLARSADPAIRAAALIRLGRNLRKTGEIDAALDAYAQPAGIGDAAIGGVPAGLVARWARCNLLAETHRDSELRKEAATLYADLARARWPITRAVYEFHIEDARRWLGGDPAVRQSTQAIALAAAVERIWNRWRSQPANLPPRDAISIDGVEMTILARGFASRLSALVVTQDYVQGQWVGKLAPLLERQHVRVALRGRGARPGANESRRAAGETGLPWTIAIESAGMEKDLDRIAARRAFWLAGLAILALLVAAGSYLVARAMSRELAVARLQSDFVSAVSHEFRTPLTSLRQLTEILSEGRILNESRRQTYYQALARQTERLHRLVESLLDFGRMEAGTSPYRLEPLDACAFVQSVVEEFEAEAAGRGYHVELDIDGVRAAIAADRAALGNALWNLLDNAVKYSPECRTVWVDVERAGLRLAIRVRDRGLGIPPGEQQEIFRKFVRGTAAKAENIKGTGIGLAMVRHIVKAHGGEIRLASEPGAGSTFTLLLPIEATCPAS